MEAKCKINSTKTEYRRNYVLLELNTVMCFGMENKYGITIPFVMF